METTVNNMAMLAFTRNPRIPLTIRKKIGKLARPQPGKPFRADLFGQTYEGLTGNHMDNKIYLYGLHEPATIRLMRAILIYQRKTGLTPVLMDVGTNAGQHLLATAPLAAQAFGFEPWEPVRSRALQSLALNTLEHTQIFPFGLSNEDASLPYTPPETDNFGAGSFAVQAGSSIMLDVRRGDSVVQEYGIAPTLLKIDVEGFESRVLQGLQNTLRQHRPVIIFEYGDISRMDFNTQEKRNTLFGEGYKLYGIKRSREYPCVTPFNPDAKYENILAWPGKIPLFL